MKDLFVWQPLHCAWPAACPDPTQDARIEDAPTEGLEDSEPEGSASDWFSGIEVEYGRFASVLHAWYGLQLLPC